MREGETVGRRWWQVGTLLPALMAALLLADLTGRFAPLSWVAFRTWEPAIRHAPGGPGPFAPGEETIKRGAYGDLAAMGNLPRLRQYHDEELHADRLGFRNGYDLDRARYAGIVTGDSFVISGGVAEPETLPGRLTAKAGARFYNAGCTQPPGPPQPAGLIAIAENLHLGSGLVIYELLERSARAGPPPQVDAALSFDPPPAPPARGAWLGELWRRLSPEAESPFRIVVRKRVKEAAAALLRLPPEPGPVVRGELTNGDEMLFIRWDLGPVGEVPTLAAAWREYFAWYAERLAPHGLHLLVLLVPNKYTIYGPWTRGGPEHPGGEDLLHSIKRRLRAGAVPVVDVTPDLERGAAEGLPIHRYLYWRDDTHWNAAGIELAAEAVWREAQPR